MSMQIPQGIRDHVNELCHSHDLFEPGTTTLKKGWEEKIPELIKDSRFVVIGHERELKDLSAVVVNASTLMGRIFWGTVGVFTPSYWNSHYATEKEIKTIFHSILEAAPQPTAEQIPTSTAARLDVPRRATGPAGRRPPTLHRPSATSSQQLEETAPSLPQEETGVKVEPPTRERVSSAIASAAIQQKERLKSKSGTGKPSRAPKILREVKDFEEALQAENPDYTELAKQLVERGELIQHGLARSRNVNLEKLHKLMVAVTEQKRMSR